ncbi:hypothetical protein ACFYNO_37405 [Kitasatospora sp. NPDC006697]|uniref:hypothetical protein n=1 Tax=Kitasatospora sp. NPDC006697 TaxID=3364020 RepID=UPI0036CB6928
MSWFGLMSVTPMAPEVLEVHRPRLQRAVEQFQAIPANDETLRFWRAGGFTEFEGFAEETGPSALDAHIETVYQAWNAGRIATQPYLAVLARKSYPASALAWAVGPDRFVLPGWFGDFVLTPEQVRDTLPQVEHAFSWPTATEYGAAERAEAERRLRIALGGEEEEEDVKALLDGLPEVWRAAAANGLALLGAHLLPS